MKEGLRKAYPNEPLPEFYRIDPREVIGLLIKGQKIMRGEEKPTKFYKDKKKELEDFFKKRIKDRDAKILIYDVDWSSGVSPGSILALLKNPENFGFSEEIRCKSVKINARRDGSKIRSDKDMHKYYQGLTLNLKESDIAPVGYIDLIDNITSKERHWENATSPAEHNSLKNYNFRGRIPKREYEERAIFVDVKPGIIKKIGKEVKGYVHGRDIIKYAKEAGREIGEQILQERQKKKNLENKLSLIIGIVGLSLVFLSPNLTGNAISNLTNQTSNIIGGGLFVIGIIGSYAWFKKR